MFVPSSIAAGISSGDFGIVAMWSVSSREFLICGKKTSNVVMGIRMKLSGLPPIWEPFFSRTPTIWTRRPLIEIGCPSGSFPSKSDLTTSDPTTATSVTCWTSTSEMFRPSCSVQLLQTR